MAGLSTAYHTTVLTREGGGGSQLKGTQKVLSTLLVPDTNISIFPPERFF